MTVLLASARRIYVDHTNIRGSVTGIERVALDLADLARATPHPVLSVRSRSLPRMILDQQLTLPLRGLADRTALVLFPGFPPAPLALALGARCVMYVHDTFLLTRPQDLNWRARTYMAPSFALAMRVCRTFLVNSRTTGEDLRRFCRADALVALMRAPARDVFGLGALAGPAPYVEGEPLRLLAVGTIEPRKDYPAALTIVAALVAAGVRAELHIVGRRGWGRHDFLDAPPPWLSVHGYLSDAELHGLAGRCHLLISTSKAEGLGMPPLELQFGGMPVVAPRMPVFSETLADSALFIRTEEATNSAEAILAWARGGGLAAAPAASRANVARWNRLVDADARRFQAFLGEGPAAYAGATDATVPVG